MVKVQRDACWVVVIGWGLLSSGCSSGGQADEAAASSHPWSGVRLIMRCPEPDWLAALQPLVQSWSYRSGAQVELRSEPMRPADDTDIGILPAAELGAWADRGDLALLPASFRQSGHAFQWTNVLPPYREHLIEWGGQAQALPLAGDAYLLVVRGDRLTDPVVQAAHRRRWGRAAAVPATWEDFAELAGTFTEVSGRPCLPPWTAQQVADLFFRVAACYDRAAVTDADRVRATPFQFDSHTAAPRLQTPAFVHAARWLAGLVQQRCLPQPLSNDGGAAPALSEGGPIVRSGPSVGQALANGQAFLAVVTLRDLEQLPRTPSGQVDPRFLLAPLPGSRGYYTEDGRFVPTVTPNYVPYYAGGWLAVVRQRCPYHDAAFELLSELGGPTRSLQILSTPGLNAGPFRSAHLDRERLLIWYIYRLDADRSLHLQDALRAYVRADVKNPVLGLRAPDQGALQAAAASELSRLLTGATPEEVLQRLTAAWERVDAATPLPVRLRWRQISAGFAE